MRNLIIVVLFFCSLSLCAQNHLIGIQGGVNSTKVSTKNFIRGEGIDSRLGYHGGVTYEYQFKSHFHIGADFLYIQKGFNSDITFTNIFGEPTGAEETINFQYDYLSLPIKAGLSRGGKISGFANLGIIPSLLVNAKVTGPPVSGKPDSGVMRVTDRVSTFDLGGLLEIGAHYRPVDRYMLVACFSYQLSFTSITNEDYFPTSKIRHRARVFSLGLKYKLRKE